MSRLFAVERHSDLAEIANAADPCLIGIALVVAVVVVIVVVAESFSAVSAIVAEP